MAHSVLHTYVNPQPDDGDPNVSGPDEWNDEHVVVLDLSAIDHGGLSGLGDNDHPQYFLNSNAAALTKVDDTNVTLTLSAGAPTALLTATSITVGWAGTLGLARGGTNADLSGTGGAGQVLRQSSAGGSITVSTIAASDIASGAALTKSDDTNVTLTLGGTPGSALLVAASLTLGWTGTLAQARGGTGSATPFANPTASVGLAAVNGVATTFMRSDAAPALSQSITPTWTGLHTWDTANIRVKGYLALGTVTTAPTNTTQGDFTAVREFITQSVIGSGAPAVTPAVELAVVAATTARIHLQNNTSLFTLSDGFQLAISTRDTYVWNFESGEMHFGTSNTERLNIATNGEVTVNGALNVGLGIRINSAAASGTYIRGNGTAGFFSAILAGDLPGSFSGFANPTATLGLAVVNGSATTAMRSDGAPALSQSIVPTWTGLHTFNASTTSIVTAGNIGIGVTPGNSAYKLEVKPGTDQHLVIQTKLNLTTGPVLFAATDAYAAAGMEFYASEFRFTNGPLTVSPAATFSSTATFNGAATFSAAPTAIAVTGADTQTGVTSTFTVSIQTSYAPSSGTLTNAISLFINTTYAPATGKAISAVYGMFMQLNYGSAGGTVDQSIHIYMQRSYGSTVPTNAYGLLIENLGFAGMTTSTAILIDPQSGSGIPIAIRSLGGEHRFVGKIEVGSDVAPDTGVWITFASGTNPFRFNEVFPTGTTQVVSFNIGSTTKYIAVKTADGTERYIPLYASVTTVTP